MVSVVLYHVIAGKNICYQDLMFYNIFFYKILAICSALLGFI